MSQKYKNLNLENRTLTVMVDGEGTQYTPQVVLLLALENDFEIARACINYIDKKRDEARNANTN